MNIRKSWNWLWHPPVDGPAATLFLRMMAGGVFLWEGIMKFVYPNLGVGRFTKLGFPMPGMTADFVAWVEILGGVCFIMGWLTRPAAIAFIIEMIVAMLSTKIGVYFGNSPLGRPPAPPQLGLGAVLHDIRSDYAQMFVSLFLLIDGAGRWSLDALARRKNPAFVLRAAKGLTGPVSTVSGPDDYQQGQQAVERKEFGTASRLFRDALEVHPDDPDVLNMLAFSERKQGHLDEAFEYYQKALTKRPRFPEAREYLAEAHLQAAIEQLHTLQGYGQDGTEEAKELIEEFKESAAKL